MRTLFAAAVLFAGTIAAAAPAAQPKRNAFMGHYGTTVVYPAGLRVARAAFGDEGDELVYFNSADASGAPRGPLAALLRICSKRARPGYDAAKAIAEFFDDARAQGWKTAQFHQTEIDGRTRLIEKLSEPRATVLYRETGEYVFQVNGSDKKQALAVMNGITQVSRKDWEATVAGLRAKSSAPGSYIPNFAPPKSYSSPLGFSISLPDGYTLHSRRSGDSEVVFLIPLRHAGLINDGILGSASDFPRFGIVRVDAARRREAAAGAHEQILGVQAALAKNGAEGKDMRVQNGPNGDWTLEILVPPHIRYSAWESGALLLQLVDGDRALGDRVRKMIR